MEVKDGTSNHKNIITFTHAVVTESQNDSAYTEAGGMHTDVLKSCPATSACNEQKYSLCICTAQECQQHPD